MVRQAHHERPLQRLLQHYHKEHIASISPVRPEPVEGQ